MRQRGKKCYLFYTGLYLVAAAVMYNVFLSGNKSMVMRTDGLYQHYNALAYYGSWLRDIVRSVIFDHKLAIPLWDMIIGYGSDVITTLNYYVLGDPLNLLSVFVPREYTYLLYDFLILFRLYLAGITFMIYCRYRGREDVATVTGAVAYAFCGFAVLGVTKHIFFGIPMVYFPLVLLGIEKIFDRKRPWCFIGSVFLLAVSNFYFFYMVVILMVLYALVRYIQRFRPLRVKEIAGWVGKFVGFGLIGVASACAIFLPVAMALMGSRRLAAQRETAATYALNYYQNFLDGFVTGKAIGGWNVMGYGAVGVLAVLLLFIRWRRRLAHKAGWLVLTGMLMLPVFGVVMNGFSYASNRWIWGYAMLVCYLIVLFVEEVWALAWRERIILAAGALVFGIACAALATDLREGLWIGLILLGVLAVLVLLGGVLQKKKWGRRAMQLGVLAVTVVGVCVNATHELSEPSLFKKYQNRGTELRMLKGNVPSSTMNLVEDDTIFRYDQVGTKERNNTAMQQKRNSTSFYFSVANPYISQYFAELELNAPLDFLYNDLDSRSILERLAAVKYCIAGESKKGMLPHTYVNAVEGADMYLGGENYSVYTSDNTLPLGYTYDEWVSAEAYADMTAVQRQQAMIQGAVTETSSLPQAELTFTDTEVPVKITASDTVEITGNTLNVKEARGFIVLDFQGEADAETYLEVRGLTYEGQADNVNVLLRSDNGDTTLRYYTPRSAYYAGRHDFLCTVGYSESGMRRIVMAFYLPGVYQFDELRVICQPMAEAEEDIRERAEDVLENVTMEANRISGDISVDEPKLLCLSVPYSSGWTAYVDGEKAEVLQTNTMYVGIELKAGSHTVELRYFTPYLKGGILISLIGLAGIVALVVYYRKTTGKSTCRGVTRG